MVCLKYVRQIEGDHCKIDYLIYNCNMNKKFHDFYFHKFSILIQYDHFHEIYVVLIYHKWDLI